MEIRLITRYGTRILQLNGVPYRVKSREVGSELVWYPAN